MSLFVLKDSINVEKHPLTKGKNGENLGIYVTFELIGMKNSGPCGPMSNLRKCYPPLLTLQPLWRSGDDNDTLKIQLNSDVFDKFTTRFVCRCLTVTGRESLKQGKCQIS